MKRFDNIVGDPYDKYNPTAKEFQNGLSYALVMHDEDPQQNRFAIEAEYRYFKGKPVSEHGYNLRGVAIDENLNTYETNGMYAMRSLESEPSYVRHHAQTLIGTIRNACDNYEHNVWRAA